MKSKQTGFTLVEIAIVLVIIGLLLGGVLKGQELINSAKAKSIVNEFRNTATMIAAYQDRFRALPGDDPNVTANLANATAATAATIGNGAIDGLWDSMTITDESVLFWQHVRLANLATGSTATPTAATIAQWLPRNSEGGRIGVVTNNAPITGLPGRLYVCQGQINGRLAQQIDTIMDDGNPNTGSVLAAAPSAGAPPTLALPLPEAELFNVCAGF